MAESKAKTTEISIQVDLNENNLPVEMRWNAEDSNVRNSIAAALFLSLWDPKQKNTMKIDLWTKDMSVEEMSKFFFQTYITMVETFEKATNEDQMAMAMRDFAEFFGEKMRVIQPTGKFDK